MAYQMAATAMTLNDLEGHSPVAAFFKCNPSNICAAIYTISTDSVLARFLCISRASCYIRSRHKTSIPPNIYSELGRKICECDLVHFVNIDFNRSRLGSVTTKAATTVRRRTKLGDRALSAAGTLERSSIIALAHRLIYTEFRRQLKSYLFKQQFDC